MSGSVQPLPGNPAGIRALAQQLRALASAVRRSAGDLAEAMKGTATWRGTSAEAFRREGDRLWGRLSQYADEFDQIAHLVDHYAETLTRAQTLALKAVQMHALGLHVAQTLREQRADPSPGLVMAFQALHAPW